MGNRKQFFNREIYFIRLFFEMSLILQIDPLEVCPIIIYMQSLGFEPMDFLNIWEKPLTWHYYRNPQLSLISRQTPVGNCTVKHQPLGQTTYKTAMTFNTADFKVTSIMQQFMPVSLQFPQTTNHFHLQGDLNTFSEHNEKPALPKSMQSPLALWVLAKSLLLQSPGHASVDEKMHVSHIIAQDWKK